MLDIQAAGEYFGIYRVHSGGETLKRLPPSETLGEETRQSEKSASEEIMKTAWAVLFAMLLGAAPCWAVLGEYENSVATDQHVMRGQVRAIARQGYSLREITGPGNAVVREFVAPSGRVFGVAWQGQFMPNLKQLLGTYFTNFQKAATEQRRVRGPRQPVVLRSDEVVIVSGGHMRSFSGMAYVPSLVPQNVSREVVR
jgi:Protein of unknown function (DUF2844)